MAAQHVTAVRVGCAVVGVAALLLAALAWSDLHFTGFPDSHLTAYDEAAAAPKRVLLWIESGLAVVLLVLAAAPVRAKVRIVGLIVGVVGLALVAVTQCRRLTRASVGGRLLAPLAAAGRC